MYIAFLVVLAIEFAIVPILDALREEEPEGEGTNVKVVTEKMRCAGYREQISIFWKLTIPTLIMCIIGGIGFPDIGFRLLDFNHNVWFTVITFVLAFALVVYDFVVPLVSKKFKEKIINDSQDEIDEFPRTKKEKWLCSFSALSSAICEEMVDRGFLLFLLLTIFPNIPIFVIMIIAFVTFGIGHLYQGLRGVIKTGLFGVLSMSLLIVTGSLIPSILLHFFCEFTSVFLLSEKD